MKIGVNARFLCKPFTGIGQYTKNLFREMARAWPAAKFVMVVPEPVGERVASLMPQNVVIKVVPERRLGSAGMRKTYWEQKQVVEFFIKESVDVAVFPYPCNPWGGKFYKSGIKSVVTVHDTIPWENRAYTRGVLSKLYHGRCKRAVGLADLVLTVSGSSMEDIVRVCGVSEEKVRVVYNDAAEAFKEPVDEKFMREVLGKLSLKEKGYFIYVGGYDERKNVKMLVEAFKGLGMPLLLVGGRLHQGKLYESFEALESGNVIRTGFVEEAKLAALYAGARAFVNISKQEGFNIPILEAANMGTALVLSDTPVHREVAENAAVFVPATNMAGVREGVEKMLDDKVQALWGAKARELARKYSWKKYAKMVNDMLSSL